MEPKKLDLEKFDIEGKVPFDSVLYIKADKPIHSHEEALAELQALESEILNEGQMENASRICDYIEENYLEKGKEMAEWWEKCKFSWKSFVLSLIEDVKPEAKLLNYNICQAILTLSKHKAFVALTKGQSAIDSKIELLITEMQASRKVFLKEIEAEISKNKREMKTAKRTRKEARDKARLEALHVKANTEAKAEKQEADPLDNELVY